MRITNLQRKALFLGFIKPHGMALASSSYIDVSDKYSGNPYLKAMVDNGLVTISNYSIQDEEEYVGSSEFESFAKGLFKVTVPAPEDNVTAGTPYILTGEEEGPFDLTEKHILVFNFDDIKEIEVDITQGWYTLTDLNTALNANTNFSYFCVAGATRPEVPEGPVYQTFTSKSVGDNASIEMVEDVRSPDLGDFTETVGTGAVTEFSITVNNPTGAGIVDLPLNLVLYDALTEGAKSTEFQIQRVTTGSFTNSEINTNDMIISTGINGVIEFEVACPEEVITESCYLEVIISPSYFLASIPASRILAHNAGL